MDRNQMLVLALANVPTIITVLIGILLNNGRLNDLNARMTSFESRLNGLDGRLGTLDVRLATIDARITALDRKFDDRLAAFEHKFDTRFDLLLSKVVDLDNRLTRIEMQRN